MTAGLRTLVEIAHRAGQAGIPLDEIFTIIKKEKGVSAPKTVVVGEYDEKRGNI